MTAQKFVKHLVTLPRLFLEEAETEVSKIREKLDKDTYSLLPISYIAKNYFGKSTAWLQQRINGYKVKGPYA